MTLLSNAASEPVFSASSYTADIYYKVVRARMHVNACSLAAFICCYLLHFSMMLFYI